MGECLIKLRYLLRIFVGMFAVRNLLLYMYITDMKIKEDKPENSVLGPGYTPSYFVILMFMTVIPSTLFLTKFDTNRARLTLFFLIGNCTLIAPNILSVKEVVDEYIGLGLTILESVGVACMYVLFEIEKRTSSGEDEENPMFDPEKLEEAKGTLDEIEPPPLDSEKF